MNKQNAADFSQGSVGSRIMAQAIPLSLAEIVQLLYNIVDRIFLGHLPDGNTLALTGVGLIFPVVSIVAAFTSLYSSGGAPIFAMARGRKDEERALQIQGTVFALLLGSSLALTALCYLLKRPLLFLFGASEDSFVFADAYLKIYLLGTPFTMLATGMNPFINAQGRPKIGMMTTVIGAVLNLALDPLFIYVQLYPLFGYRMYELYTSGMKTDASIRIRTRRSVFQIPFYGRAHLGQLTTNLMMTACLQIDLQQIIVIRTGYQFIMQHGFFGVLHLFSIRIGFILLLIPNQIMSQLRFFLFRTLLHDGPIGFLYLAILEHFIQAGKGFTGFSKDNQTAYGTV